MSTRRRSDPLQVIPGIGPSLARDLRDLGYEAVGDLQGQDPEAMYLRLGEIRSARQDPCVLYTFRCAVYFASTPDPDPELLKWWRWKGRTLRTLSDLPRRAENSHGTIVRNKK